MVDPIRSERHPAELGIDAGYHDVFGNWRAPTDASLSALRAVMGLDAGELPPAPSTAIVVPGPAGGLVDARSGASPTIAPGSTLLLEDGTEIDVTGAARGPSGSLPGDLPIGHHRLFGDDGLERPFMVSPGRCHLPGDLRIWGLTAQLYAARSSRSWGMGDLGDLGRLVGWATARGARIIGLNPLHAPTPSANPPNSPYSPSSRRWRDPSIIAIEAVPGFAGLTDAAERRAEALRLLEADTIDRAAVWSAKRSALELLWIRFREASDPAFDRYLAEHGHPLMLWGAFCTIADERQRAGLSASWQTWPFDVRRPDAPGVRRVLLDRPDEVRFWCWLQWLAAEQLATAGSDDVVLTDMAVGFAADGFDAWDWQDLIAEGVRIGAPPDLLGPDGQDWGLPPLVPWKLEQVGYKALADTLRAVFDGSLGVRIDHVMGLFRLFWLPPGGSGADGAYVRFRGDDLVHVLAIESARAGGIVVGEDLGTVEAGVREKLAAAGVLSTRLLWFEDDRPADWPAQAQAAVTTHDLPTVAGIWSGTDLDDLRSAGVSTPPDGDEMFRHRLRVAAAADDGADVELVAVEAHRAIAGSPSMIATAALDDLVGARHRPNVPGTIDEHPNWRIPLPVLVDDLDGHSLAESIAEAMGGSRRPSDHVSD